MPISDNTPPDLQSKTQRKNDMHALQELGKKLVALSSAQLAKVPLPDALAKAIEFAHTLKSNESKRRHMQYIGKLMRQVDVDAVMFAYKNIQAQNHHQTESFHSIEKWRDDLIKDGDKALPAFLNNYPDADRQQLRQRIRKAQLDDKQEKNTGGRTGLFRYLREIVEKDVPDKR